MFLFLGKHSLRWVTALQKKQNKTKMSGKPKSEKREINWKP